MPRYDFQCLSCSYTFEEERPFESNGTPPCPQCGEDTEKLIAPPAIHFKGEGFYNTDSVKKAKPKKEVKKDEKPKTQEPLSTESSVKTEKSKQNTKPKTKESH